MRIVRQLAEDGLESFGTLSLPAALAIGDPGELVAPAGSGRWFGAAVLAGTWWMFGRPGEDDELIEELVLVHDSALPSFYAIYDELVHVATVPLPHHRLAVLAGGLQKNAQVLKSLVEPEAFPWVLEEGGVVVAGIEELPAHVAAPRATPVAMLAIGLARAPDQQVPTQPYTAEERDPDES